MSDVTVRLQALDGAWETCGADRARGVWPENVELTADRWGPKSASFDLRRDPKSVWPDLGAFTPVEVDVDGVLRWSGRVAQTPVRDDLDSVISVQCEGWQAHLDDDLYEKRYVHTRLGDWKDMRSALSAVLGEAKLAAAPQVTTDRGITLSFAKDGVLNSGVYVGVFLDLGPDCTAARVVMTWESTNNGSGITCYCKGADTPDESGWAGGSNAFTFAMNSGASGTSAGTFTAAKRYVQVFLHYPGGSTTATADVALKITSLQVFAASAYESGNASVLKSDVVVEDALQQATILLDPDRSLIDAGTFNIPEFAMTAPRTPRQAWEAVDAFEDRTKKIDARRRPIYTAKSVAPEVEVGAFTAMSFEDSAANDGGEVYSQVTVVGEQPDGTPLRVTRTQADVATAASWSSVQPSNPGFETNTAGWSATLSTITRTTTAGQFEAGSAGGRWDNTGADDNLADGDLLTYSFAETFKAGVTYRLELRVKPSTGNTTLRMTFGFANVTALLKYPTAGAWNTVSALWTPKVDVTNAANLVLEKVSDGSRFYLDSMSVFEVAPTIVNRRRFVRSKTLDIGFALTESAAQQIADKWLAAHQRTPSKGTLKLTGPARHILTGQPVQPEALLDRTDHMLRLSDRIDPDTGAVGRDVRIAEVSVRPETREATVQLDSTRGGFDALLSRLEVVLGQGR